MKKTMDELVIRPAGMEDLDALVALEHAVARELPAKEMFVVDEREFYEPLVAGKGQVLLALHGGRLAGAGIMAFPGLSDADNLGRELGFASGMLERVVHIESVYVSSGFRGKGLARILTTRNLELASENGRDLALSTVWPGNASSMSFLYALGLTVRKLTGKYGGLDRFIMLRMPGNVELEGPSVLVPCLDLDGHRSQLAQGRIGVGIRRHADARREEPGNLAFSVVYRDLRPGSSCECSGKLDSLPSEQV